MLNEQQVERFNSLIYRLGDFYFGGSRVYFSAGSLPNLLTKLIPSLLASEEPEVVLGRWEEMFSSFLNELAAIAAEEGSFASGADGQHHLLVSEGVSARFVNSEWWGRNCPKGI